MEKNKEIVALWGSAGAGKTTLSVKLAAELSRKREVILIMCDLIAPSMPLLLPMAKRSNRSLRNLFARRENRAQVRAEDVVNNLVPADKKQRIHLLAYEAGDNHRTFAGYDKAEAHELLTAAVGLAPIVIVDCVTDIAHDLLSLAALEQAGTVFRIMEPDIKSLSCLKSALPLLSDEPRYLAQSHRLIVNNMYDGQDSRVFKESIGTLFGEIHHCPKLHSQFASGALLEPLTKGEGVKSVNAWLMTAAREVLT